MVTEAQISQVLLPWIGTALTQALFPAVRRISDRFNGFTAKQDLRDLDAWLRVLLYGEIRRITCSSMVVQLDSGNRIQMRTDDFEILSDDLLYLLFSVFPPNQLHLAILKEYAMSSGSLSAYRALITFFRDQLDPAELSVMEKVILGFPATRLFWYGRQSNT